MKDDFLKYEKLRDEGSTPESVYNEATRDGLDSITKVRLIRGVFSLSPREAKEIVLRSQTPPATLDQFQENISNNIPDLTHG